MVGARVALEVEPIGGPRWDAALDVLEAGTAAIGIAGLALRSDPATEIAGRRLHVEFPCPHDPLAESRPASERLASVARNELDQARRIVEDVCDADARFARLVKNSDVIYEYVYDYGMGTLLIASASSTGPITWEQN